MKVLLFYKGLKRVKMECVEKSQKYACEMNFIEAIPPDLQHRLYALKMRIYSGLIQIA